MPRILTILALICALLGPSCATQEPKATPFKLPEAYANVQRVADGLYVAARAWDNAAEARAAFGFDIVGAGILPVQVSFDNRSRQTLAIVPSQTFLINARQEIFPVLAEREAYERVSHGARLPQAAKSFAKGGLLGGATGALVGAAVGVVAGGGAGEYALRGLTAGATSGGVLGAYHGATEPSVPRDISRDLSRHELKNTPIRPGELAYGLILFPHEAGKPQTLRLQLKDQNTGQVYPLGLNL